LVSSQGDRRVGADQHERALVGDRGLGLVGEREHHGVGREPLDVGLEQHGEPPLASHLGEPLLLLCLQRLKPSPRYDSVTRAPASRARSRPRPPSRAADHQHVLARKLRRIVEQRLDLLEVGTGHGEQPRLPRRPVASTTARAR